MKCSFATSGERLVECERCGRVVRTPFHREPQRVHAECRSSTSLGVEDAEAKINDGRCALRGVKLRNQKCDVCSYHDVVKEVFTCPKHEECFEGSGGFRVGSGKGPSRKIAACRFCEDWIGY
jgi:hypothetical protein